VDGGEDPSGILVRAPERLFAVDDSHAPPATVLETVRAASSAVVGAAARIIRPISLVAAAAACLWPGAAIGPSVDASVFVLAGSRLRQGIVPYAGTWDSKPPGAAMLNALGQMALPWLDAWLVGWLLTVVFTAASVLLIDDLLRRKLSPAPSWAWSLVACVVIAGYPIAIGGGMTESFAVLPLVAALWALASWPRTALRLALIGFLLAGSCLLSLQSAPAAVCIAGVAAWTRGSMWLSVRRGAALLVGAAPVPLAVASWLLMTGAAAEAIDQVVAFNFADREWGGQLSILLPVAVLLLVAFAIPACVAVVSMIRRPASYGRLEWACLAWFLLYSADILYQGRLFLHFLVLAVPPLVVLAGVGTRPMWEWLGSSRMPVRKGAAGLVGVAGSCLLVSALAFVQLTGMAMAQAGARESVLGATGSWIRSETPSNGTMFIWGADSQLFLDSARIPASAIVDDFPIVAVRYWTADRTAGLLADWQASPPTVIVEGRSTTPLFRPAASGPGSGGPDTVTALREFVRTHYRLVASFANGDYYDDVYVLVAPG
jgi:hypothetical protein